MNFLLVIFLLIGSNCCMHLQKLLYLLTVRLQIFSLERGTKQECPLSPLSFALIIEPLAETVRASDQVTGIQTNARTHKISVYADDLLLSMKEPSVTPVRAARSSNSLNISTLLGRFADTKQHADASL